MLAPFAVPANVVAHGGFDFLGIEVGDFLAEHGTDALALVATQTGHAGNDAFGANKEDFTFEGGEIVVDLTNISQITDGALAGLTGVITIAFDEVRIKK